MSREKVSQQPATSIMIRGLKKIYIVSFSGSPRVNAMVSPLVVPVGGTATLQVYVDVDSNTTPEDTEVNKL